MKFLCFVTSTCIIALAADNKPAPDEYAVHEWGTFTSVAGPDGLALKWQPFGGPTDLPCFVHRLQIGYKASLEGTVRMETPVLYFYTPNAMTAHVHVAFPNGNITEWYPSATLLARPVGSGSNPATGNVSRNGIRSPLGGEPDSIDWPSVAIKPGTFPQYGWELRTSHYYAARSTDSAPLSASDEAEKFLFYRGVGEFQPPIAVENTGGALLRIKNLAKEDLPAAIVFENVNGRIHYRSLGTLSAETETEIPQADADLGALKQDLEHILIEQGLFPKEAHAMVETWRDSWFEEGTRVFYILPAGEVDSILPLRIEPRPARIARVFVGRVEVITAETRQRVVQAIARGDRQTLEKYGRFLQPIARQLPGSPLIQTILEKYLTWRLPVQIATAQLPSTDTFPLVAYIVNNK